MTPIRFAIWAAVSTKKQAEEDKFSLEDQEAFCRKLAAAKGWRETAGPYVVPGESRTRWVNLRDAEDAIVNKDGSRPLRDMLDAAKNGAFDLLMLYDYTRLRDLLDPVAKVLRDYGVQVYSATQATDPLLPEDFAQYGNETEETLRYSHGFASRAEINSMRKRYRDNMPARIVAKGLHSTGPLPTGYRKPPGQELNKEAVAIWDDARAAFVIETKDRLLAGQSLTQIGEWLEASGIPAPGGGTTWHPGTIRRMLSNPFYAGVVRFGETRHTRDRRTGRRIETPEKDPSRIVTGPGKHVPLWDETTYHAILRELRSRGHAYRGRVAVQLSRLLECSVCGSMMWTFYMGGRIDTEHRRWLCSKVRNAMSGHAAVYEREFLPRVAADFARALRTLDTLSMPESADDQAPRVKAAIAALEGKIKRWQDAYENGLDYAEFSARVEPLRAQLKAEQAKQASSDEAQNNRRLKVDRIKEMAEVIDDIPAIILNADPQETNARLRSVINKIVVQPDGNFEFIFW